jgi:hypothetical protein
MTILLALLLLSQYRDPAGRFQFEYPAGYGTVVPGTNSGYGDRVAALRFSALSGLGGEAALTRGFPMLDLQAAGGLYDAIALEVFPAPLRVRVVAAIPELTARNLCDTLARESHIDLSRFPAAQRDAIRSVDSMRNHSPAIRTCAANGETVIFHKETSLQPGSPRQHVFGAVRFLPSPYSTFQFIRAAGDPPSPESLREIEDLVNSWTGATASTPRNVPSRR